MSDSEEEKRTESVLFSFPFIMEQKERTHFLSPFRKEERKSKRRLSFFILFLPQTEWQISSFPEKRKKEKDEKTEERRQKEEGQKRKGTERRKKEKEARERRTEEWTKRQRNMSQKGAFLTQESRKRTGRGFPVRKQETGLRMPFFAS